MSSISIVQEYDRFTYLVDTAQSCVIDNSIYRVKDIKAQKTYQIGNDVVFMSGIAPVLEKVRFKMLNLIDDDNHINAILLQDYLKKELPPIYDYDSRSINGFDIMSIIDGKAVIVAMKQSFNHFEIIRLDAPPKGSPSLSVDGFENDFYQSKIFENEKDYFNRTGSYNIMESILHTYRGHYSEGVGGELHMFRFDKNGVTFMHSEELREVGLKYVCNGPNYINGKYFDLNFDELLNRININGSIPVNAGNIGQQSVSYASNSGSAGLAESAYGLLSRSLVRTAYISAGDNFIPGSPGMHVGSSLNYWAGAYLGSGSVVVSDRNKKHDIESLTDKYKLFASKIIPVVFKYNDGTSGRTHVGFIAQQVEETMIKCGITDMEFAGLIKSPIYSKKLLNEKGEELQEYDITSEIIGYDYGLRYEEFIPLLFDRIINQEERLCAIEKRLGV